LVLVFRVFALSGFRDCPTIMRKRQKWNFSNQAPKKPIPQPKTQPAINRLKKPLNYRENGISLAFQPPKKANLAGKARRKNNDRRENAGCHWRLASVESV
jgi:hypothetical protein